MGLLTTPPPEVHYVGEMGALHATHDVTNFPATSDWAEVTCPVCLQHRPTGPDGPAIAVPANWTGTDAEAVGLAVAGAVGGIQRERDLALQHLGALVSAYPETSWAASSSALDAAKAFLADMGQEAPEGKP